MSKKTIVLIVLTALVSGLFYALPTFAATPFQGAQPPTTANPAVQEKRPRPNTPKGTGEITALDENSITVQTRAGREITLAVDEHTVYVTPENAITFADLQVGDKIAFEMDRKGDSLVARVVIQIPEGYDLRQLWQNSFQGEVWAIGNDSITLQTRRGEQVVLYVDGATTFQSPTGLIQAFGDLQVHMQVGVFATPQDDGRLHANVLIAARPRVSKHLGTVAAVDGSSLTLDRRDGQRITVQIDAETRFKGGVASLADVQSGMKVIVAAYPTGNGTWTAVLVGSLRKAPQGNNTP